MRSGDDGAAEQRAACDLLPDPEALPISQIDAGIRMMRRHYATADALANRYGAATNRTLLRLSLVVFMAALSFDLAVHILVEPRVLVLETLCLFGLPVLTGVAMLIHRQARRQDYQNRYQDYRGLAEGLRIQFFWRLAGVGECVADHYLGRHRYEMQWIRDWGARVRRLKRQSLRAGSTRNAGISTASPWRRNASFSASSAGLRCASGWDL
jgi:hypothetical protein